MIQIKKISKIFYRYVPLLLLLLLLAGCADDINKKSPTENLKNSSTSESKPATKSDDYKNPSSENTPDENNSSEDKDDANKKGTQNGADKDTFNEKSDIDKNDSQNNIDNPKGQNEKQNTRIKTNTDKKDQEKAISLVKDYLRDKGALIEDENNFVGYDGEINSYIIVRYSTLVSGHTSTNGRYAVNLHSGELVDVTANPDFFN
ncbi:hypothetical protein ACTNDN_07040 [Niallia sp. HCP3S3_B10]|uniref:hypothetical protein n=1 Tax=Niallia sp. HCP3S3_B10 TaxID=3438944 RepID=UPI003F89C8E5